MNEYMNKAIEIINEWDAMTGTERHNFCRNCVLKAIREGRRLANGDELGDAINNTYVTVAGNLLDSSTLAKKIERRASQGFNESLAAIISRAAKANLQREMSRAERDSVVISDTAINDSGEEYSLFDSIAGASDTEKTATIRAALKDFYNGLDSKNKTIFGGMIQGKTERETAPEVDISNTAVHKRIAKIRANLAEILS